LSATKLPNHPNPEILEHENHWEKVTIAYCFTVWSNYSGDPRTDGQSFSQGQEIKGYV